MKRGVYVGRFQPFHNGHLQDIQNALKEVDELAIGIGSSQESGTEKNPFTVTERMEMISLSMKSMDIENYVLFSVPDFHDDEKWMTHIEDVTSPFKIAFIADNDWTERCFKNKGYQIKKLPLIDGLSASQVREKIKNGEDWDHLVPKEVSSYIEYIDGVKRIQSIR